MGGRKKQEGKKLRMAERRAKSVTLYKAGWTYRDIAAELDVSHDTIAKDIQTTLAQYAKISEKEAEEIRFVHVERIQAAVKAIWQSVGKGNLKAIHTLIRLMEREAKLLGLDAPTKVDLEHRVRRMADEMGLDPEAAVREAEKVIKR